MILDEDMTQNLRKELKELNEKNLEGKVERSCWENQQRKNKLVVDLWKTSQNYEVITDHKRKWLDSLEERRNAKLHFKRIWRINCTSRHKRKRYLNSTNKNLDEHLKNELNHEEPPWRTPVTKGWWDRMKDERIRWALRWLRWRFRRDGRGNLNFGKEKMKTLGTRIYSSRTNSEEKGLFTWMK